MPDRLTKSAALIIHTSILLFHKLVGACYPHACLGNHYTARTPKEKSSMPIIPLGVTCTLITSFCHLLCPSISETWAAKPSKSTSIHGRKALLISRVHMCTPSIPHTDDNTSINSGTVPSMGKVSLIKCFLTPAIHWSYTWLQQHLSLQMACVTLQLLRHVRSETQAGQK